MIKKISREEIEALIKKHYGLKDLEYYRQHGYEGYGECSSIDYEFVEGQEK